MDQKALLRLEQLRRLNSNRNWVNKDLYRLMYRESLYIVAYQRIKSAPGNMTPGTDGETLDGWSLKKIREIVQEMRTEQFQFKPVRVHYIPKENGKMRKLGIPSVRDKVVQEVIRMILEAVYDSPYGPLFNPSSHGFRPGRSCHTALREIRQVWTGVNWIIEGDIQSCFDDIDHHVLISILRKKIADERFINLIWKLLRAGYMDMRGSSGHTVAGTPQGGIVSPILANIYLNELDEKVDELRARYEGPRNRKRPNPEYRKLNKQRLALIKRGNPHPHLLKELTKRIRSMPSVLTHDPEYIRIRYVRYADDWVVGVIGPHSLAVKIKEELKEFLHDRLKLTLSEKKTCITHAKTEQALFLGTYVQTAGRGEAKIVEQTRGGTPYRRRISGTQVILKAPVDRLVKRLAKKGFCTPDGKPTPKRAYAHLDLDQLIRYYASINWGIINYYRFADNFPALSRVQFILLHSLAMTIAYKLKLASRKNVFKKFGRNITVKVPGRDGKERKVCFQPNRDWSVNRLAFSTEEGKDFLLNAISLRTRSKLGKPCCICGETEGVEMHHVRSIRSMLKAKKVTGFQLVMRSLNRKQIPVCKDCHWKIHAGRYDGIKLSDLAYDPR